MAADGLNSPTVSRQVVQWLSQILRRLRRCGQRRPRCYASVLALHRVLMTNDYQEGDSTGRDRDYQKGGLSLVFVLL